MKYLILILSLLLFSIPVQSAGTACSSSKVYVSVQGDDNKIVNVGNKICLDNSILITFPDPGSQGIEDGHLDFDQSIVWRIGVKPKRFSYNAVNPYIQKLNSQNTLKQWRLPTFEELHEFRRVIKTKNNSNIHKFSRREVWAEPEDEEPSFYSLELGNRYSGTKFTKKRYLLLVSAN